MDGARVESKWARTRSTEEAPGLVAQNADLVILLAPSAPRRGDLAPLGTLFEMASLLLTDGVVAELMARLGETEEGMRRRHATLE